MKRKVKNFFRWFIIILVILAILGLCGFVTSSWWQALGAAIQQIVLAILGVGILYYCVLPIVVIVLLIGGLSVLFYYGYIN